MQPCVTEASYTVDELDCYIECLDMHIYEVIRACVSVVASSHTFMILFARILFVHKLKLRLIVHYFNSLSVVPQVT